MASRRLWALALLALALSACGSNNGGGGGRSGSSGDARVDRLVKDAAAVRAADFPATGGRTLQQIADGVKAGPQVGLASSVLLPGTERIAFGVISADRRFVYGRSALYVATSPGGKARGPYPAPADSIVPQPRSSAAVRRRTPRASRQSTPPGFRSRARVAMPSWR